jgi:hypothetical protein
MYLVADQQRLESADVVRAVGELLSIPQVASAKY